MAIDTANIITMSKEGINLTKVKIKDTNGMEDIIIIKEDLEAFKKRVYIFGKQG